MGNLFSHSNQSSNLRLTHRPKPLKDLSLEKNTTVLQGKQMIEGRIYHTEQDSIYPLPMDDREIDRLHEEHFLTKELLGCNIMTEATKRLDFQGGELHILDVCCGPATWLCQTSLEYPNCHFTGVDMSAMWPQIIRPVNLSFHCANVLHGLPFPDQTFDFIQLRFVALAFKSDEWARIMLEIRRVLKDGGLFQCIDMDLTISKGGSDFYSTVTEEVRAHQESDSPIVKEDLEPSLYDSKLIPSIFEKFCAIRGIDKTAGAKLDMMLSDARMTILQSEYREVPLGWGGLVGEAYYEVYKAIMDAITPMIKLVMEIPPAHKSVLLYPSKQELVETKSYVGLYAFLAQKPLDD
ncbi:S-adenosyl-L-methionine-dependent methyltransferase [Spinellus fusiger]|nr:S-adenosyl-L-methionine-dependent methyltransferase [Spinellus fusiger]